MQARIIWGPFAALLILLATGAQAAAAEKAPKAGAKIATPYFSLVIPKGWYMPAEIREQPNGGISAVFALAEGDLAITFNIIPAAVDIPAMSRKIAGDMRSRGLEASDLQKRGVMSFMRISGKISGEIWFGANNTLSAITTLFGRDVKRAKELLTSVKPVESGLFPQAASL